MFKYVKKSRNSNIFFLIYLKYYHFGMQSIEKLVSRYITFFFLSLWNIVCILYLYHTLISTGHISST